jgi:hypothetical protein
VTFYLHPWEIDPEQPRVKAPMVSRFRHYRNLEQTEPRLQRLLAEFRFATAFSVVSTTAVDDAAVAPTALRGWLPEGARN